MKPSLALLLPLFLAAAPAFAEVQTKTIDYTVDGTTYKGYLAYDDAKDGQRPGVLVVPEWWGLNEYAKTRARELAELGYVAFAADMYGQGKTTSDPKQAGQWAGQVKNNLDAGIRVATEALNVLKNQEQTDPDHLAAIGYCFGGSVVLQMARANVEGLDGVVSFHGSLGTAQPATEKPEAAILVLHGAADPMVSDQEVQAFKDEMQKVDANWQLNAYGNAVHSFTNPNADQHDIPGVAYNEQADQRSWEAMQTFFDDIFSEPKE